MAKRHSVWGTRTQLFTGLKTLFFDAYDRKMQTNIKTTIAMQVDSNGSSEEYDWVGGLPMVREFIGERQSRMLESFGYTLKNKEWESTIEIKRTDLEDDKFGQIKIKINGMADSAAMHQEKLVAELLVGGFTALCFDGQYFFDTDHVVNGVTVANKVTTALSEAAVQAGVIAMQKFTDDKGNILGINPTHLVVGPDKQFVAGEILKRYPTSDGKPNLLAGLQLVVSPYVTGNNWFLLDCSRAVKPLVFQLRTPVEFQAMEEDSDSGFMRASYAYGTYARYNAGYSIWQLGYGSTGG